VRFVDELGTVDKCSVFFLALGIALSAQRSKNEVDHAREALPGV
jgi:hypothetical protein